MTVSASYAPLEYAGNGATVAFPVNWPFVAASDLLVTEVNADGFETVKSLTTHYAVAKTTTGGTVTALVAPAKGVTWRIERRTPLTQPGQLRLGGAYTPETVEAMIDRPVLMVQEVAQTRPDVDKVQGMIDASAPSIASGSYEPGSDGAKPSRLVVTRLRESRVPLTEFAEGDGVANDTAAFAAWLTALSTEKRTGFVPEGNYLIDAVRLLNLRNVAVEAHPAARIIGSKTCQRFAGDGTTGQAFTVTDFTLHVGGTYRAARITSAGLHVPLTVDVDFSISGATITMLGSNVIAVNDSIHIVSSELMLEVRSDGASSARARRFVWEGGEWDVSQRGMVLEQASGSGLGIYYFRKYDVAGVDFYGSADYETGYAAGVADSGFTALYCDNGSISDSLFQGFGDLGVYATGGELATAEDDGIGLSLKGNHFVKCAAGWKAARQLKNVVANGNTYDRCWIGAALWPASDIKAGRGSITNERFYRCGRNAIDVRQQVGCVVANNTIIDPGYLLDGVTAADQFSGGGAITAINMAGCKATKVAGNVIVMDELAPLANSHGIRNLEYTFNTVTDQPTDNIVHDNLLDGFNIGIQENGTGTGSRYNRNHFRRVTTEYSGVPAAGLPFGGYTPILTNITNIDASTLTAARFRRDENDITVDFVINIDPTTSGAGELRMSLPVDPVANFAADSDLIGIAFSESADASARIHAQVAAKNARLRMVFGADVANRIWVGSFRYRVPN